MKSNFLSKALYALLALLLVTGSAQQAQAKKSRTGAKPAFDLGSKTLGVFVGFGVDYDYYGSVNRLPALGVTYDQGIVGNAGPGTVGLGGVLAFKAAHYDYGNGYKATWTDFIIGARGTYHLTILKDKNNKFDPYAGVTVGVRISSYHDTYYDYSGHHYTSSSANPVVGAFVGAKYNFTPGFGAFSELGYDISFFRIGVNFNF